MVTTPNISGGHRHLTALVALSYVATVILANWTTHTFGQVHIGFNLVVTAGTFAAASSLVARDAVQQTAGRRWAVPVLILLGAALSAVTSNPALALASGLAFISSEMVDWGVYTPLRGRSLPVAVVVSSLVAAPVDTALFLHIAGFPVTPAAVAGQVLVKTAVALAAAGWLVWRRR